MILIIPSKGDSIDGTSHGEIQNLRMYGYFLLKKVILPLPVGKIWYDNATYLVIPCLRVFSTLHHLTREENGRPNYINLNGYSLQVKKIPEGISYALSSICEHANGIPFDQNTKISLYSPIKFISKLPIRLFL